MYKLQILQNMKTLALLIGFFLVVQLNAQGRIIGGVIDEKGNAIPSAIVVLKQNDSIIKKTETNYNGDYKISNIEAGFYDVEIRYKEVYNNTLTTIQVKNGTLLPLKNVVFDVKIRKVKKKSKKIQ
jgi:hypothetical protein